MSVEIGTDRGDKMFFGRLPPPFTPRFRLSRRSQSFVGPVTGVKWTPNLNKPMVAKRESGIAAPTGRKRNDGCAHAELVKSGDRSGGESN
jgi:hypothetical protein